MYPVDSGLHLSQLDVLPLVLQAQVPTFARDLHLLRQAHMATSNSQPDNNALEADDVFELYKTVNKLGDLFRAFVPGYVTCIALFVDWHSYRFSIGQASVSM